MRNLLVIFIAIVLLSACRKDEFATPASATEKSNQISFAQAKQGQTSKYVLFRANDYFGEETDNYTYLSDTLIVTVKQITGDKILISEHLSAGSISLTGVPNVSYPHDTWEYYLVKDGEKVHIEKIEERVGSRLFFCTDNEVTDLPLPEIKSLKIEIEGWKCKIPFSKNKIKGFTTNYNPFGERYRKLNVLIDNEPMQEGHPGQTFLFSSQNGLVRSTQYSAQTGNGFGWDLLPE